MVGPANCRAWQSPLKIRVLTPHRILAHAALWLALGTQPLTATAEDPATAAVPPLSAEHLEFFEKEVRPLLARHCHDCHGAETQEGDLRLDSAAGIRLGGHNGPPISAGNPDESLLIEVIQYGPDSYQMPPDGKLPEAAIATLTKWIELGAPWPDEADAGAEATTSRSEFNLWERARHWSFQPITRPELPPTSDPAWCQNEIDHFILAGLDATGLAPAPAADKRTWLRRVTFDLIGLPPQPADVAAFLADDSAESYERVVDRLLNSEHYGERWGRHWLDLARYAETYGHEFDYPIPEAWRYRDYVIRAFNADLPYDQFLTEHLAGDLLTEPRRHPIEGFNESTIGTGFFLLGETVHSPVDIRGDEADRIDNQIEVFTKTFLGLTVSCARCHDHKFDPITAADYYALAGYLQSSRDQLAYIDDPTATQQTLEQISQLRNKANSLTITTIASILTPAIQQLATEARELALLTDSPTTPSPRADSEATDAPPSGPTASAPSPWQTAVASLARRHSRLQVVPKEAALELSAELKAAAHPLLIEDFSGVDYGDWFVTGEAFGSAPRPPAEPALPQADALPEVLASGLADSGRVSVRAEGALRSPTYEVPRGRLWTRVRGRGTLSFVIDSHRLIHGPLHQTLRQQIDTGGHWKWISHDLTAYSGRRGFIEILDSGEEALAIDRVLFANETEPNDRWLDLVLQRDELLPEAAPATNGDTQLTAEILTTIQRWADSPSPRLSPKEAVTIAWLLEDLDAWGLHAEVSAALASHAEDFAQLSAAIQQAEQKIQPSQRALALAEGTPEDERIHLRGNHKKLGEVVPRRLLEVLGGTSAPAPTESSGRRELALQLTDPANPLVTRVIVNRLWHHHFGRGLVASTDNFGILGEDPTHPELLDWLATEFVARGWSLKQMHRLMVLSSTYRMSGQADPRAVAEDPANRLWHHMPARRLEGEVVRDSLLAVAGSLQPELYGPSVMPHLTPFMQGRGRPATSGPVDGAGRRSIYINVRRNFLTPLFTAFDYPPPYTTSGQRTVSHVPAQALMLLNNPLVLQQADLWAARIIAAHAEPRQRIEQLYLEAYARPPTDEEAQQAMKFVDTLFAYHTEQDSAAPQQQAWAELCHVLFNLKEFIFVH